MLLKYILKINKIASITWREAKVGDNMVQKSHGIRYRTRKKLKQKTARRPAITKFLQNLKIGKKVEILPEPSSHKGMPYPNFKGKVGRVIDKRGNSYIVEIKDGGKKKLIISRPEHLKKV